MSWFGTKTAVEYNEGMWVGYQRASGVLGFRLESLAITQGLSWIRMAANAYNEETKRNYRAYGLGILNGVRLAMEAK